MSNETNPTASSELKVGAELKGKVKNIELYGAFVDIGVGQDALLHVSQLGKPNIRNVEDVIKVGEEVTVYVLRVDPGTGRIALSLVRPATVTWDDLNEGQSVTGTVVRLEKFGVFVDIGAERPAMVHVSELADGFVKSPGDVVRVGQEVNGHILKINRKKRQIDMSLKAPREKIEIPKDTEPEEELPTAMAMAFRRAMTDGESATSDTAPKGSKAERREKRNQERDAIIERTLRHHNSTR